MYRQTTLKEKINPNFTTAIFIPSCVYDQIVCFNQIVCYNSCVFVCIKIYRLNE